MNPLLAVKRSEDTKMERLTLKDPVTITGPSPIAPLTKQQAIEMRPLSLAEAQKTRSRNGTGWYWETSDGTIVPIDMSLVREAQETRAEGSSEIKLHPQHYLYFQRGKEHLNCVEHILALKALGLDGVVIKALGGSNWVPYDGRAKMYWEAIQGHLRSDDGHLEPMTLRAKHTYADIDKKRGWTRSVTLDSTSGKDELVVTVNVDFQICGGKKTIEHRFPVDDPSKIKDILCSRPLMGSLFEKTLPLIKAIGWPHAENLLTPSTFDKKNLDPYLHELALHRMLDLLGAMALLAEAGTHVAGKIDTDKGSHGTDMRLLQELKTIARQMYPDMDFLAPAEPFAAAPASSSGRPAAARKSAAPGR